MVTLLSPLVEMRRQVNKDSFFLETDSKKLAEDFVLNSIRTLLDKKIVFKYKELDLLSSWEVKIRIDSVIEKHKKTNRFDCEIELATLSNDHRRFILIPYLIWTRTTDEYHEGACGKAGYRDYINKSYCTWTSAEAYLFLVNRKTKKIVYYKKNFWSQQTIYMPFQSRIYRSFERCVKPLLRKVGSDNSFTAK